MHLLERQKAPQICENIWFILKILNVKIWPRGSRTSGAWGGFSDCACSISYIEPAIFKEELICACSFCSLPNQKNKKVFLKSLT